MRTPAQYVKALLAKLSKVLQVIAADNVTTPESDSLKFAGADFCNILGKR
jgi:hypothetical protein